MYNFFDDCGYFGLYGGVFVVEMLIYVLDELCVVYEKFQNDFDFVVEFECELKYFVGCLLLIYYVQCWSEMFGGVQIYLKCEDLNYMGVYKINNVIGQVLFVKCMGKKCVIVEIGVGQYGVVIVMICVCFGMECVVYMGLEDVCWQVVNVYWMKLFGVIVVLVELGLCMLKDVLNEVMCDWVMNIESMFYIIGMVVGLYLYLMMVCDFQCVIGDECKVQMFEFVGWQLDVVIVCVGGGLNVMGIFYLYIDDILVQLIGVEVVGDGFDMGYYVVLLIVGSLGVLYGNCMYLLQDDNGQIIEMYLVLVGFDYLGVGFEYVWLKDSGCVQYVLISDDEVLKVFYDCCWIEGIIFVFELSYVIVYGVKFVLMLLKDKILFVNLLGCGDKDMYMVVE